MAGSGNGLVTINGAGARATTIDGNGLSRVLTVVEGTVATINDVTVTGGNSDAAQDTEGGGIWVEGAASLALNRSAVRGNRASATGGGIRADGALVATDSTISGNQTGTAGAGGQGAGIYADVDTTLINTTVSGNVILAGTLSNGGGVVSVNSNLLLRHVTIAGNTATSGGLYVTSTFGSHTLWNTIVTSDSGTACAGSIGLLVGDHNIADDATCGLTGAGDKPSTNPLLGALANYGGPTDTRALSPASPAINAGNALQCRPTDQRGVPRPAGACDIGAFEYVAPRLTVRTTVVNDDGRRAVPGDVSVHVRTPAGADVAGSPRGGTPAGSTYTLAAGAFAVAANGPTGYALTIGGACTAAGAVSLAENQVKTCTIVANDVPPVVGKSVNAEPEAGRVRIKLPGRRRFRRLTDGAQLPVGTTVDTRNGRINLTAAQNKRGGTASADFFDGLFKLGQTKGRRPITTLTLVEKLACTPSGNASAAAKRKKKRRLWGNGRGRFRTKGRHSAATVLGTKWLVEDRCTSTLTRVVRGRVSVRDEVLRKTVIVRRGKRYVARAAS